MVLITLVMGLLLQQAQTPHKEVMYRCKHDVLITRTMTPAQRTDRVRYVLKQQLSRYGGRLPRKSTTEAAFMQIMYKESTYRTWCKNPNSSAYGLGGFLNSTWKSVGLHKTDCPSCQIYGILRYVEGRYGSAEAALRHHNHRGWY